MKILSGTSNLSLSKSISKQLKLKLVNTNIKNFSEKYKLMIRNSTKSTIGPVSKDIFKVTNILNWWSYIEK